MPIAQEKMILGDIVYELSVRDGSIRYYGGFFCKACWEGRVKYDPLLPTANEAMSNAQQRATAHHLDIHANRLPQNSQD